MAKTHAIVNTTSCACWDVDALNHAGIYATADVDNGTLVTLVKINRDDTSANIKGYEYEVTPAAENATNVFIVDSPEVGYSLEQQIYVDPREFYNEAGKPMSIKNLMDGGVDCVEVDAVAFTDGTLPTAAQAGQYVGVAANGKFAAPTAAAPAAGAYFRVEGLHSIACGPDIVPTVVLRCMNNR